MIQQSSSFTLSIFLAFLSLVIIFFHPLLLVLYPTRPFRRCLHFRGFRRWDIVCHVMDIFQGWYKDGTKDTQDFRPLSALCLLLRIGFGCEFIIKEYKDYYNAILALGVFHVMLGTFFFVVKPYKKHWMCHADGLIFTLVGILFLMSTSHNKVVYIIGAVIGISMMVILKLCGIYQCVKECKHPQEVTPASPR